MKLHTLLLPGVTCLLAIAGQNAAAAQAPFISGYFTNWSVYDTTSKYDPTLIPPAVDEIVYAFAQAGDCARVDPDAEHPNGYATEVKPEFCAKKDPFTGTQTFKTLNSTDPWSDFNKQADGATGLNNIAKVLDRGRAVTLSVGGWSLSAALREAVKPDNRVAFAQSILDFMTSAQKASTTGNTFSGVDIDWEPNGNQWTMATPDPKIYKTVTKEDLDNFKAFLVEMKKVLREAKAAGKIANDLLRIAAPACPEVLKHVDTTYHENGGYWKQLAETVDTINLMTYDFHGPWENPRITGFNAGLKNDPRAEDAGLAPKFSMQGAVERLMELSVASKKIVVGVPMYGRTYDITGQTQPTTENPYVPFKQAYQLDGGEAVLTNRLFRTGYKPTGDSIYFNFDTNSTADAQGGQNFSWAWGNAGYDTEVFITYDDAATAKAKMQYASEKSLAGVMVWSLDGDVREGDKRPDGVTDLVYTEASVVDGLRQGKKQ